MLAGVVDRRTMRGGVGASAIRKRIVDRDHGCLLCGRWEPLQLHHICPRSMLPGKRLEPVLWDERNLCMLCAYCHDGIATVQGRAQCIARLAALYGYFYECWPWEAYV